MVYAYTNFNLGDDLFIKVLTERYPNTKFILWAPKEYKEHFRYSNLKVLSSDSLISRGLNLILRKLNLNTSVSRIMAKQCHAAVYIGGSLFMQEENWERNFLRKRDMRIENKPFFLIGANFGPFKDEKFYLKYKELFKTYTDICFRDRYSYNLFSDLRNVRLADDIIFQYGDTHIRSEQKHVILSVIKPSYRKYLSGFDLPYYNKMKEVSMHFIDKGYKVTLMSFCENEGDGEAIDEIMNIVPKVYHDKLKRHSYRLDIEETLNLIAQSSFIVGARFHSMILGWAYNKPVFPIVYSEKMTNVMRDVGFQGLYTDFAHIGELRVEEVVRSMETNYIDVSKQVEGAAKHFEKLDEYLVIEDI